MYPPAFYYPPDMSAASQMVWVNANIYIYGCCKYTWVKFWGIANMRFDLDTQRVAAADSSTFLWDKNYFYIITVHSGNYVQIFSIENFQMNCNANIGANRSWKTFSSIIQSRMYISRLLYWSA